MNSCTVVALGEIFPLWRTWLAYICGGLELFLADLVHLPLILIIHIIPITHQNHFLLSPFFFILIINLPQLGLNPNSIIFRFTFSWVNFKLGLKLPDQRGQMSVFGNFSQTNLMLSIGRKCDINMRWKLNVNFHFKFRIWVCVDPPSL